MKQEEIKQCPIKATFPGGVTAAGAVLEVIHRKWQSHSVHGVTQRRRRPQESPVVMAHTLPCSYTFDLTAGVDRAEHDLQPSSAWVCEAPRPWLRHPHSTDGNRAWTQPCSWEQQHSFVWTTAPEKAESWDWTNKYKWRKCVNTAPLLCAYVHARTHMHSYRNAPYDLAMLQLATTMKVYRVKTQAHKRHWPKKSPFKPACYGHLGRI